MATETVKAPMPGVFYRRSDPEEEPFAEPGDQVEAGDVVGMIGVMKNFHEIETEVGGTISQFLVENEGEVEANQGIVEIETE